MSYEYTGFLLPQLPAILSALKDGQSPRDIAEAFKQPQLAPMIRYIGERYELLPNPPLPTSLRDRNRAIVADRRAGMFLYKIAEKYGISRSRAAMLCEQEFIRERRRKAVRQAFEEATDFDALPLDAADIQVRTLNCFRHLGCTTIGEALQLSDHEMLEEPNFGRKSLHDWKRAVEQLRREFAEKAID